MKKFTLFLVFLIVATMGFGQYKLNKVVTVLTATTKLGTNCDIGDHVYCKATGNEYILQTTQGGSATVTSIVAGGNYTLLTTYSATPTLTTLTTTGLATLPWIHATHTLITNDSVTNLVASTLAKAPTVSVATTLNLPGTANTVTKTTGNANSVTFAHSAKITDTVTAGTAVITGNVTGNALIRDSVAFSTSDTRVAKAVAGALASSFYVVTAKAKASSGSTGRPVAGDLVNVYPKTDSVIFMRQAGTTSGLVVYFIRLK